jgi:NIMA (never in mitosis gene a)-related kinase 1/4/5
VKAVIKQIDITKMGEEEKKSTLREAKIMEELEHPNIIRFREVYKTKRGKLCIVMDYADGKFLFFSLSLVSSGGDLGKKIKDSRGMYFQESQIVDWFTQISLALKHLHDRKIIHRDLKAQNVFLTKQNTVKLGDFGIARVLSHTMENAQTMVGTPYYLAPEIVDNKPYGLAADMWSMGVLLYEMSCLKPPFDARSLASLAVKIVKGHFNPIPSHFSRDHRDLITSLLRVNPKTRPRINDILSNKDSQVFMTRL